METAEATLSICPVTGVPSLAKPGKQFTGIHSILNKTSNAQHLLPQQSGPRDVSGADDLLLCLQSCSVFWTNCRNNAQESSSANRITKLTNIFISARQPRAESCLRKQLPDTVLRNCYKRITLYFIQVHQLGKDAVGHVKSILTFLSW